jgi:hypothetical protein
MKSYRFVVSPYHLLYSDCLGYPCGVVPLFWLFSVHFVILFSIIFRFLVGVKTYIKTFNGSENTGLDFYRE